MAGLALEGRLHALPDLGAATASTPPGPPPETWEFRLGSPGTVTDNCTVATRTTTVLQGYNDHLAIYAEPIPDSPLEAANIDILLRHYEVYGAEVIESWGGVADIDGNGRIIVYLDANLPGSIAGLVWVGDMLPTSVCAASNEAELMRLDRSWAEDIAHILASTVVHEAQHVNSVYKRLLNTLEDPFSYMAQHPVWVEEGRAVMAAEAASRLAWADLGGPASHEQATAAHVAGLSDRQVGVAGILQALSRVKYVLREDANSLTHFPDPYGSGWHLHRFLADWYGGAGRGRLGDAAFIRRLTATETPPGAAGIEEVTGRPFKELMLEYATAISLAGTGAPRLPGVARFSTYDFTGLGGAAPGHLLLGRAGALPLARHDERGGTGCQALGAARVFPDDRTRDQGGRHPGLRPPRLGARRGGDSRDRRAGPCGDRRGPGSRSFPPGRLNRPGEPEDHRIPALGRSHRLTACNASCTALGVRVSCPLAGLYRRLNDAAAAEGLAFVG